MSIGGYILGIVGASLTVSVVSLLVPEDGDGGMKRGVGLICSLALLCVILAPLTTLIGQINDGSLSAYEITLPVPDATGERLDALYGALAGQSREEIEEYLSSAVIKHFELPEGSVTIEAAVTVSSDGVSLTRVTVILGGRAMWQDPREIKEYVTGLCGDGCTVEVVNG